MIKKNKLIIIISLLVLFVVAGLYGTFATDSSVAQNGDTYTMIFNNDSNVISVPANSSKIVIFQLLNTNNATVKYNVGYSGDNITVKGYSDSLDSYVGTVEAHGYKYIKLRIENTGSTDSTATIVSVLGYEYGGTLIIPQGITLVTEMTTVNLAQYIKNLYNDASKVPVSNNGINYNYATSVSLMNDRLGGTTLSLDGGNIRYFGANPNNYIDIGDRGPAWATIGSDKFGEILSEPSFNGFNSSEECSMAIETLTDCSKSWELYQNLDERINSVAVCEAIIPNILETLIQLYFGVDSVDEAKSYYCTNDFVPSLYRIIGVFDGKAKLIRNFSIGNYAWDISSSSINDGYGINQWGPSRDYEGADLMRLLNSKPDGTSYTGINGSFYWNRGFGNCYFSRNSEYASCDFTNVGLNNEVKSLIASDIWYLGGRSEENLYVNEIYSYERGEDVCGKNDISCDDNIQRTTTWTGKIGLMYPSDYGYAVDFNNCEQDLSNYADSTCTSSNWLFDGLGKWTITPVGSDIYYSYYRSSVFLAWQSGEVTLTGTGGHAVIKPVFSLISNAEVEVHEGMKSDPYVLSLP